MSAHCMDCDAEPGLHQRSPQKHQNNCSLTPKAAAKRAAAETAGEVFWLSIVAENGPIAIKDICCEFNQRQKRAKYLQWRLQQWHEQDWEEDTTARPSQDEGPVSPGK